MLQITPSEHAKNEYMQIAVIQMSVTPVIAMDADGPGPCCQQLFTGMEVIGLHEGEGMDECICEGSDDDLGFSKDDDNDIKG